MSKDIVRPQKFDYVARDKFYWGTLSEIFEKNNLTYEDILRNWSAYIMRRDLPRFLVHYELFKMALDLPGCFVELGVYRGASFFTWSMLLETLCATDRYKKIFGFDHFEGLKGGDFMKEDGMDDATVQKNEGGYKCTVEEVRKLVEIHNIDNMLPGTERCRLIEGDVEETLPRFLDENPGLKICFLHFDLDLYKPTKFCLEVLYPLVVTGGIICFDEYGLIPWQGETKAVDEYFAKFDNPPLIKKFRMSHVPHGYIIK